MIAMKKPVGPPQSIYNDIEKIGLKPDLQSWPSARSPVFEKVILETNPKIIIEVGSWKGRSAIRMAQLTEMIGTRIYCVDTWLGSLEHMMEETGRKYEWPLSHGHPLLYWQFLLNVKFSGVEDRITPIVNTSMTGASYLYKNGVRAEMIYIDGDHTADGCYRDLMAYWELLTPGGVIFGDDYFVFPGVKEAVDGFCQERKLEVELEDPMWIIRKQEKAS